MTQFAHRIAGLASREDGASAVEFALILTPLLFLMIGIVDFGLAVWGYNNLSEAVRQGARYAIVRGAESELGQTGRVTDEAPTTCDTPFPAAASLCTRPN